MTSLRLLFYNSYLLRPVSLGVGRLRWEPGSAVAVGPRATELGGAVAGDYDVVALAEAFDAADRERILGGWRALGRAPEVEIGPEAGWDPRQGPTVVTSGLMTVVDGPRVTRRAEHRFAERGNRLVDADPWAAKGVLMVEIDVGLAAGIEIYSTHLCAGGGLLPLLGSRLRATDRVRLAQAAELVDFLRATHRPENLAIVVGDMNVAEIGGPDHDPSGPHRALDELMGSVGLEDLWTRAGHGHGPTCTLDHEASSVGRPDPDDPRFAWDDAPGVAAPSADAGAAAGGPTLIRRRRGDTIGQRIDRVFLQRAQPDHRVEVREASIRRRTFPRRLGAPGRDRLAHLSDHLGLHVEIEVRNRAEEFG